MMSDLNFNPIPSEIKYFIPGKETVNDIPNVFGSLQKIDLEVVNSYTTDLSGIYHIITVDDKSTWVNDWSKKVARQINIDNDNITTTKQISCVIYDMTLTSNNDILLSVGYSSDIKPSNTTLCLTWVVSLSTTDVSTRSVSAMLILSGIRSLQWFTKS